MKEKKIRVLQIGERDLEKFLSIEDKEVLEWTFFESEGVQTQEIVTLVKKNKKAFDVVLCTEVLNNELLIALEEYIEAYSLVIDFKLKSTLLEELAIKKVPYFIDLSHPKEVIKELKHYFFSGQMGTKLHTNTIRVTSRFSGKTEVFGESYLVLTGDYNTLKSHPLLTWQYNIGVYGRSKKLWLEFEAETSVTFKLILLKIRQDSTEVIERCVYTQEEVKAGIEVPYERELGYLSISLEVQGQGKLKIGPLHFRDTRGEYGEYILGGKKITDEKNQELFYYFNPADLKPPLNVYFSGYRPAEGFEGFYMMKAMGAPFLLITDPRLEGGAFYMGSSTLEEELTRVIQEHLDLLGFSKEQLVLSGLSMGTYGALYYASHLEPGHIIVGKPLVNVGDIAKNEKIIRPGVFPTSLDILNSLSGSLSADAVETLNQRFWSKFSKGHFDETQFIVAYMIHDDYDVNAYKYLLEYLSESEASIIGKGIPGRHNDNSEAIYQWFISQYKRILLEKFHRTKEMKL